MINDLFSNERFERFLNKEANVAVKNLNIDKRSQCSTAYLAIYKIDRKKKVSVTRISLVDYLEIKKKTHLYRELGRTFAEQKTFFPLAIFLTFMSSLKHFSKEKQEEIKKTKKTFDKSTPDITTEVIDTIAMRVDFYQKWIITALKRDMENNISLLKPGLEVLDSSDPLFQAFFMGTGIYKKNITGKS